MASFLALDPGQAFAWAGDNGPVASVTEDCTVGGDASNEPPSCVYVQPFGDGSVAVGWQWTGRGTPATVDGFYVYRSEDGSNWTKINPDAMVRFMPDGRPTYTFLDIGYCGNGSANCPLKASTRYYYAVTTYASGAESVKSYDKGWSSDNDTYNSDPHYHRQYTSAVTFPPRPVRGVNITDNGDGSATISWQANPEPNVNQYKIYRAQKSTGVKANGALVATVANATSYTVTGLVYYQDYYFVVTAVDGTGAEGVPSVERWVLPRPNDTRHYDGSLHWAPPHGSYLDDTSKCTICHGIHSAPAPAQPPSYLLKVDLSSGGTVASLCFTCHDGTGSNRAVKTEFYRDWDGSSGKSAHPVLQASAFDAGLPDANGRNYYGLQLKCTNCHSAHLEAYTPANTSTETPRLLSPRLKEMNGQQPFFRHKGEGVCYTCHGNGALSPPNARGYNVLIGGPRETPFEDSAHRKFIRQGAAVEAPAPTLIRCLGCHKPHGAPNARLKVYEKPYNCVSCHGPADGSPVYHVDHSVDGASPPNSNHEAVTGRNANGNAVTTVQNTPPDIYSLISANPPDADTRHDIWPYDDDPAKGRPYNQGGRDPYTAITCTNCHNPHTVQPPEQVNGSNNYPIMIDPYNPSPTGVWSGASESGNSYPGTGALAVVGFCWRCHDNTLPTASSTLPWAPAPSCGQVASDCGNVSNSRKYENMWDTWYNKDSMGYKKGSNTNLQSSLDFTQWPADSGTSQTDPNNTNRTLPCTQCHDPHGSPNPYRLKPFIKIKIKDSTVCSRLGQTAPCYETKGPLIVYRFQPDPTPSGPPVDVDPRFFCGACHNNKSMGFAGGECANDARSFPMACTRCHGHGTTDTPYGY